MCDDWHTFNALWKFDSILSGVGYSFTIFPRVFWWFKFFRFVHIHRRRCRRRHCCCLYHSVPALNWAFNLSLLICSVAHGSAYTTHSFRCLIFFFIYLDLTKFKLKVFFRGRLTYWIRCLYRIGDNTSLILVLTPIVVLLDTPLLFEHFVLTALVVAVVVRLLFILGFLY